MKPLKNKVSITLDEDIINRIKELAEEDDRSFSQYINLVLRDHIRSIEKPATKQHRNVCCHISKHFRCLFICENSYSEYHEPVIKIGCAGISFLYLIFRKKCNQV